MSEPHSENLRLLDFMDVQTLQEIQDSFAAVANVKATITDASGNLLTQPAPSGEFLKRQQVLAAAEESQGPTKEGREYVAPIIVAGQRLGTIRMRTTRTAAVQFLFLLANAIARLCYQEFQLRQRIDEITTVYNLTMMLADQRDLQAVLQKAVRLISDVMGTKAASIRLLDEENDELVIKAVHNLSPTYLNKGPVRLSKTG